jgi:dissimilatory sulfite reductase (desulfoviridin) alpha/beta subunit
MYVQLPLECVFRDQCPICQKSGRSVWPHSWFVREKDGVDIRVGGRVDAHREECKLNTRIDIVY